MVGTDGPEIGTAVALVETEHKKWILDGWSFNGYGGLDLKTGLPTAGLGIEKKIYTVADMIDIGAGVYVTKKVKDMFSTEGWKGKPNIAVGLSGSYKF